MKTKFFFSFLLAMMISLSSVLTAQTTIYITPGSTHRVTCWADNGTTLDTGCDVNLDGNHAGDNQDILYVPTGTTFFMEAGIEDAQFDGYDWMDVWDSYTWEINNEGSWFIAKYSTSTGYTYVGHFTVVYYDPVTTYDVTFTVTESGTGDPINGASVTCNSLVQTTNSSGVTVFTDLEDGSYPYTVTASGYVTETGNVTVSGGNEAVNVVMTETEYNVEFTVKNGATGIEGAEVTVAGEGTVVTSSVGTALFHLTAGTYSYDVTADGYADYSGNITVSGHMFEDVDMTPTGVGDVSIAKVVVYPNPVVDVLHITDADNFDLVQVVDMAGHVLFSTSIFGSVKIDFASSPKGVYLVRLSGNGVIRCLKIIK